MEYLNLTTHHVSCSRKVGKMKLLTEYVGMVINVPLEGRIYMVQWNTIYPERILINVSILECIKLTYIQRIFPHRSNDKDIQPVPCSDEVTLLRLLLGTNSIMLLLFKHEVRTSY